MKRVIQTKQAPAAIGPYSQAIRKGDFLFASGQLGINPVKVKTLPKNGLVEIEVIALKLKLR